MKAFHMMGNVLLPKTAEAKSLCKDQKSKKKSQKIFKNKKKELILSRYCEECNF